MTSNGLHRMKSNDSQNAVAGQLPSRRRHLLELEEERRQRVLFSSSSSSIPSSSVTSVLVFLFNSLQISEGEGSNFFYDRALHTSLGDMILHQNSSFRSRVRF